MRKPDKTIKINNKLSLIHFDKLGGIAETSILYNHGSFLDIKKTNSDSESICDCCIDSVGCSPSIEHEVVYEPYLEHELEIVCPECGTRYILTPEITVHYKIKSCSNPTHDEYDENYISLLDRYSKK